MGVPHGDDITHLLDNVLHDGRALGIDDPLGTARQPIDLPLRVPARADRHDLLHARHVLPSAVLHGLPEILQADGRGAVVSATLVVRRRLQVLGQVGFQALAAGEVGGYDAEDSPATLAALRIRALVVGGLLHQLAVNFVAQLLVLVTVLRMYNTRYTISSLDCRRTRRAFALSFSVPSDRDTRILP